MTEFDDRERLFDTIDGLFADYGGADSGIHDDLLKRRLVEHLQSLDGKAFDNLMCDYVMHHFLRPEARAHGYGFADVVAFARWLSDDLGFDP